MSANNFDFVPSHIDQVGAVVVEALKLFEKKYGKIDQLVAHSLGTVFLANALKQVEDTHFLPEKICLDRGPISTWEASKKYFGGLGRLIYYLAKAGGWAEDVQVLRQHHWSA